MPNRQVENWTCSQVMLRCFLVTMYLWLMVIAASIAPVLKKDDSKWLIWTTNVQYSVTYSSHLSFDGYTQGYIIAIALQLLYRLFVCCRCNFFGSINNQNNVLNEYISPFDRRLILYFGPYLALFLVTWSVGISDTFESLLQIYDHQPTKNQTILYSELAAGLIFKVFIFINITVRYLRGMIIIKLLSQEPENSIRNDYNFGEHLKLFFQY